MNETRTFNEAAYERLPRRGRRYVRGVVHDFGLLRPGPYVATDTPERAFLIAVALFAERNPSTPVKYTGPGGDQRDVPPGAPWTEIDTPTAATDWGDRGDGEDWRDEPWIGFDGKQVEL